MTTAYYRAVARDLQARCEWAAAASAYQKAIDAYPESKGALAERDLRLLAEHRDVCKKAAATEAAS